MVLIYRVALPYDNIVEFIRSKKYGRHRKGGETMNQTEETKLLEQIEQWNKKDEYSRCIRAIEAIPEQERGYLLTVKLRCV